MLGISVSLFPSSSLLPPLRLFPFLSLSAFPVVVFSLTVYFEMVLYGGICRLDCDWRDFSISKYHTYTRLSLFVSFNFSIL